MFGKHTCTNIHHGMYWHSEGISLHPLRDILRMGKRQMEINQITEKVIGAAIAVHRELGPGLLESVYHRCMCVELKHIGILFESEVPVPVAYRGIDVHPEGFSADLIIENSIIVELKSIANLMDIHKKQLLTYLRLCNLSLGLLINFNEVKLVDGLVRVANRFVD